MTPFSMRFALAQEQDGVNPQLLLELISVNAVIGNKADKRIRKNVHVIHIIIVHE
jgi:hypothetical protein